MHNNLDNAPCLYFSFSDNGSLQQFNSTLNNMLGYKQEELAGKNVEYLFTISTRIFYQTHFFPMLKMHGHAEEIFITLKTKEGNQIPVLLNASRTGEGENALSQCVCITVHHRKKFEEELLAAKKAAEKAVAENEELSQAKKSLMEHTMHLDERMQVVASRNDELGQLNRVLSHELQEPIRKIQYFAHQAPESSSNALPAGIKTIFEKIEQCAVQMQTTVSALQQYVWLNDIEKQEGEADLNKLLLLAKHQVEMEFSTTMNLVSDQLPVITGFDDQLQVMFYQLLKNAMQYRKPGEHATIKLSASIIQENRFRYLKDRYKFGNVLKLEIKDEGIGFDPVYNDELFDLFKRLHMNSGKSIGLALCKKIVDNHRGIIKADGKPGLGTNITIVFPLR